MLDGKRRTLTASGTARGPFSTATPRAKFARSLAAALLLALGLSPNVSAQSRQLCDRPCLRDSIDGYLLALAAHDPARLDVAPGVAYTENGRAATLGEGLWRSAGTPHIYRDYALDPEIGRRGRIDGARRERRGHAVVRAPRNR